ncbi:MAG TPA: hypothetical protein VGW38_23835, partial [Chloroflexota bacterium]|nr:hypothetical protein [Chloroflexota bacterium]
QEQNGLLKQQAARYEAELARASAQAAPIISYSGGSYSAEKDLHDAQVWVVNKGGFMKNLVVEPLGEFSCWIKSTDTVLQGQEAEVDFEGMPSGEPSLFHLHYDDTFGKRHTILLEYQDGHIREPAS